MEDIDLQVVRKAMRNEADPIPSAGIFAPAAVTREFVSYFPPDTPFSFILRRLHEISRVNSLFHLCELDDQLTIADLIEPIRGLSVTDRIIICRAPVDRTADGFPEMLQALAKCIAERKGGELLNIKEIPLEILDRPVTVEKAYLESLEALHKGLTLYLWLSYRFEDVFPSRPLAFHYKEMVEINIDKVLSEMYYEPKFRSTGTRRELEEVIKKIKAEYKATGKQGTHPEAAEIPIPLSDANAQNFIENSP
jgi:ATP-dependent RNA helicase SUPV3L1/SUV3